MSSSRLSLLYASVCHFASLPSQGSSMELVALARNPVPSGPVVGTFAGHDGTKLRFARWDATRGPRRGTACVFPGRGEFIEKYFEVIADLRRRGYAVAIHDWRGQGGSARALANPRKGYVRSFAEYDADLTRFMKDVVLPDCPPPYIALAHSMGGNVLMRNATIQGSWFDRHDPDRADVGHCRRQDPDAAIDGARLCLDAGVWAPGRAYVWHGSDTPEETKPFEGNASTSDPERYQRNRQIVEAAPAPGTGLSDRRLAAGCLSLLPRC